MDIIARAAVIWILHRVVRSHYSILYGIVLGLCGSHYFCCQIHRIYGSTGASFAKAQQELAQGVLSNKAVQQTAGNMASSAARATVAGAAR